MSHQYDFVAIGDILMDAFIELRMDMSTVLEDIDTGKKILQMPFGGKIPYQSVVVVPAVGNSPNAAVSAHRLGLETALVSDIGHDKFGKECLDALRQEGIATDFVKVHEGKITNYHYVLRHGAERTILIQHETYPYSLPDFPVPPRYIYFSSVGEHGIAFHHEIARYVIEHPETKLVFQPGTFQIKLGVEELKDVYEHTEIFFCNKEESQEILKTTEQHLPTLLRKLQALGPKIPVITDGPNGAYTLDANGEAWHMPMYPDPADPVDRTGAGDSFASTFTAAIILGKSPEEALAWGPINSMSVVQKIGAQAGLLTREKLEEFLANRPAQYVASKIS
ncbi:MAG: carbohydrate kinase family protein [Patescibacteria group bacterium]